MIAGFLSETTEAEESGTTFFKCWGEKNGLSAQNSISSKNILQKKREIKTFPDEGKLRGCGQQTYPKRMAKGSSLNQKR